MILFHEVQRFRQAWIWLLMVSMTIGTFFLLGWGLWQQLVLGRPWGNNPASNTGLLVISILVITMILALDAILLFARLETIVRPNEMSVRFWPFHLRAKLFRTDEIASFRVRTYRPIREYGGWGIRFGPRGRAYNAHGNQGVELTFEDGTTLLVGSQKARQLGQALVSAGFRRESE